ncbi:hypothetical protein SBA5_290093 [Candidatus Sulfotelmatomonas gaucii]|uniref:Uncharacterized protein n=1 Tax=Candidatus Sulfuritelmatomonas gaucii TaxID=2043161 RepID=A0A2N9LAC4_9BACT|nr:hypothetical protein SBA5_290093 [Candidatus Sulfotelmatomonas gaucii]
MSREISKTKFTARVAVNPWNLFAPPN